MKNDRLKVFLGDLSYINNQNKYNLFVPLNIGYIASYAKKLFKRDIEITLFKDPQQILDEIRNQRPAVLGLSFYYWNTALNHAVVKETREILGENNVTIVWGGPSVDSDISQQGHLFERFPEVDAFITNEGELGFANIIGRRLSDDISIMWNNPIDGVVFKENDHLVSGADVGLSLDLDLLESPYLTGLMDPFLGGEFMATLQTSRFCPYTCTFCVSGKNVGKLRGFPLEQVTEEIAFISRHYKDKPHLPMHIVDENFGILKRDEEISDFILQSSKAKGYPKGMFFYNDKRFGETAKKVIGNLGNMTLYGMALSLQTENPETLKEIKRRNLTPEQIDEAIEWASSKDLNSTTELIFGLPYETRESFIKLLNNALERGFDSILVNNLFIVDGIEMAREGYREKHQLQTRFRPTNSNQGYIGETFCSEYEEVVVGTNCFSIEDFKFMRLLNFMFYVIFSLGFNKWFFQYIRHLGVPLADYLESFISPSKNDKASAGWMAFIEGFEKDAMGELFDSPEEVREHCYKIFKENGNQVGPPALLNIRHGAQLIYLESDWLSTALINTLEQFISRKKNEEVFQTVEFLLDLCEKERVDLNGTRSPAPITSEFDLISWKRDKFQKPLDEYRIEPKVLYFIENPELSVKLPEFKKSFAEIDAKGFYFNALQFIVPRTQLLYILSHNTKILQEKLAIEHDSVECVGEV